MTEKRGHRTYVMKGEGSVTQSGKDPLKVTMRGETIVQVRLEDKILYGGKQVKKEGNVCTTKQRNTIYFTIKHLKFSGKAPISVESCATP